MEKKEWKKPECPRCGTPVDTKDFDTCPFCKREHFSSRKYWREFKARRKTKTGK